MPDLTCLHDLGTMNLMPAIIKAAPAYATTGEITQVLREIFGELREPVTL